MSHGQRSDKKKKNRTWNKKNGPWDTPISISQFVPYILSSEAMRNHEESGVEIKKPYKVKPFEKAAHIQGLLIFID